jgi:tetratricopeptide (TPR) repeat protein
MAARRSRRLLILIAVAIGSLCLTLAYSAWQSGLIPSWRSGTDLSARAIIEGRDFLKKGKLRRAIHAVSNIRSGDSEEADAWAIRGMAYAALEDVTAARMALERAWGMKRDPMTAKVLSAIYLAADETDRGLQLLQAAAKLDPSDFRPWYAIGEMVFRRRGHNEEAAEAFSSALRRLPSHVKSRIGLIDVLLKLQRLDQVRPTLQSLRAERPDDPEVLILAVRLALATGDQGQVERDLDRVLSTDPDRSEALFLRAQYYFRAGRTDPALTDVKRALGLSPNDLAALNLLASIQSRLGQKAEASATAARRRQVEERSVRITELSRQIAKTPDDPLLRCRLAALAAEAGLFQLARQSYQAALALDPHCDPARQGLLALRTAQLEEPFSANEQ